jgi:hypothetical protein
MPPERNILMTEPLNIPINLTPGTFAGIDAAKRALAALERQAASIPVRLQAVAGTAGRRRPAAELHWWQQLEPGPAPATQPQRPGP